MKPFYLSIPIIFMFLIGCSTTYKVSDYFSKEDLYKKANSSMKSRDVNVVTVDSSFTALEGSRIKDDSLQIVSKISGKIPLSEIKAIKYYGSSYETPSASVWLKSGTELNTKNIKILSDSSVQFTTITNTLIPLTDIKHLSYTNHWVGLGTGIFAGMLTGFTIGYAVIRRGDWFGRGGGGAILIAMAGTVIGAIVGIIIGWDYIYQFGP